MKKIPGIFLRDWDGNRSLVTDECNPECLWVFNGEGVATRKFDGTAVLVEDGKLYCRYDAKAGKQPPPDFVPADNPDTVTGHWAGWVLAQKDQHKWQLAIFKTAPFENGTYEACGPHFQGNPEGFSQDEFIRHGSERYENVPTARAELIAWLLDRDIEGLVWHHPDGRMAKIKKKDFGLKRRETHAK
jgi:Family of unknown function (DUF5565)